MVYVEYMLVVLQGFQHHAKCVNNSGQLREVSAHNCIYLEMLSFQSVAGFTWTRREATHDGIHM